MSNITKLLTQAAAGGEEEVRGERMFIFGTHSYIVPAGVTSISAVCIGAGEGSRVGYGVNNNTVTGGAGGGLAFKNNITVTPGETLTINVGSGGSDDAGGESNIQRAGVNLLRARGGGSVANGTGGQGGTTLGFDGGGNGGNSQDFVGGGAAGYSGNGGGSTNAAPAGGGGSGGSGPINPDVGGGGGGVGPFGEGASGASTNAGGSGGENSAAPVDTGQSGTASRGGVFGGGSGGYKSGGQNNGARGAPGCVRIVYPGDTRTFPSTDVNGDFPS